ncbi:sensor histidine kinase, partial [Dietzia natronolimnaea]|nr:sensor histidine kinase [Dietzia natronolimnaea]
MTGPSRPRASAELPPESAAVRAVFTQLQVALHTLVAALLAFT